MHNGLANGFSDYETQSNSAPISEHLHDDRTNFVHIFNGEIGGTLDGQHVHRIHPDARQHIATRVVVGVARRTVRTGSHSFCNRQII